MSATQIIPPKRYIPSEPDAGESITSHVDTELRKSYLPIVWPPELASSVPDGVNVSYVVGFLG